MRAEILKAVQKLYAVGILVYFAAAGIGGVSISDFSDWASFMGRHAVYAFAWPVAAGGAIVLWWGPPGAGRGGGVFWAVRCTPRCHPPPVWGVFFFCAPLRTA